MKIIDRYLVREMAGPFVFGVLAFVLLFVSGNILFRLTELVAQLGISLWTATELFFLWLPAFIVLTFPLATLVGILVAFGRLSGESELIAMHAGGISFRRLVIPIAIAGLVIAIITAAFNELIVPAANRRADHIVQTATMRAGGVTQEEVLYKEAEGDESRIIYADHLDLGSGQLVNPVIVWFQADQPAMVTKAKRAVWAQNKWELFDGSNTTLDPRRPASVSFDKWTANIPTTPRQIAQRTRTAEGMTYRELRELIRDALRQNKPTVDLELKLHHKLSIPFACFVFALIAPPLGVRSHRGSSSIGMGIAILIGFGYYVVWHYLSAVASQGALSPFWAAWLPNVVTGAVGVGLIAGVRK
ncbi:MAG: LptF/LptG family permease [Armatimonadota bacterium]